MSKIVDTLLNVCNLQSDKTAIIYAERKTLIYKTFSQLKTDVMTTVSFMYKHNVKQGDKILAFASSSYKLCVFMLSSLVLGTSIMYVDIFAKQKSLKKIFEDYTPDMILVSDKTKHLRFFFKEFAKIKNVINIDSIKPDSMYKNNILNEPKEESLALLTMTTGSTGIPKVALRTHGDLMQQMELIKANTDLSKKNEIALTTSYIYVFANILSGITTVLPCLNLKKTSKHINKKLSLFSQIPITMIITTPDFCLKANNVFPKLKKLYCGGAILNLNEAKRINSKFSYSENIVVYGSTECNIMCEIGLDEYIKLLYKTHSSPLGYKAKGVSIRLNDDGEIMVTSNALLEHYLKDDTSSKTKDENGLIWHHTNDIAVLKNEVFYFLGKNKYYIIVDDKKIYSNEIEQKIISLINSIPKCAVLQKNDTIYVFLENHTKEVSAGVRDILLKTYNITHPKIIPVKKIPCDVKHHTKIDYNKLKKGL